MLERLRLSLEAQRARAVAEPKHHVAEELRRQLRALDDRMLDDIGISRERAEREAAKPFWEA